MSDSLQPHGLLCPWILQARMLEWVATSFSKGVFQTKEWNPGLLHCRQIHPLSHQGSPKVGTVLAAQTSLTLCGSMDHRPPGSPVHGILQARILEWVGFPSPGDLPDPGIEPGSPTLQVDPLPSKPPGKLVGERRGEFETGTGRRAKDLRLGGNLSDHSEKLL